MPPQIPIIANRAGGAREVDPVMLVDANGLAVMIGETRLQKRLVNATTGVAIPGATAFCGIIVTTLLAGAFARFYDGTAASGEPFCQMPLTAIGVQALPIPIALTTGLWVAPSSALTIKFWVLYL